MTSTHSVHLKEKKKGGANQEKTFVGWVGGKITSMLFVRGGEFKWSLICRIFVCRTSSRDNCRQPIIEKKYGGEVLTGNADPVRRDASQGKLCARQAGSIINLS